MQNITLKNTALLIAMSLALAIMFLDQTAVSVALPAMQASLNANNTDIQWIVNAYLLATSCTLILGGKLSDLFGQKRIFFVGLACFMLASLTTALAQNEVEAIASRALQGIGAALFIPGTSTLLFAHFPNQVRGRVIGIQTGIASIFLCFGPMLGGYFTDFYTWRYIFWINLPICIICAILVQLSAKAIPPSTESLQLDWRGFLLSTIGLFCVVFGIMQTADWGWLDPTNLSILLLGGLCIYAFIRYERKVTHPFVDLSLFKDHGFLYGSLILLLIQTNFITRIFVAIYFQVVLEYSAFMAGLLTLASTIPLLFAGPLAGYLRDLYGARLPVLIGSCCITCSAMWIAGFAWIFNYGFLIPGLVFFSIGAPLVIATTKVVILNTIPTAQRGSASGVSGTARSIGGALGLALMSTIIISLEKLHLNTYLSHSTAPINTLTADDLSGLLSGVQEVTEKLSHLSSTQFDQVHLAAKYAYTFGFSLSMLVVGLIGLFGVYLSAKLPATSSQGTR